MTSRERVVEIMEQQQLLPKGCPSDWINEDFMLLDEDLLRHHTAPESIESLKAIRVISSIGFQILRELKKLNDSRKANVLADAVNVGVFIKPEEIQ